MDEEDINSKELTGGYADFSHSNCHNTCLWIGGGITGGLCMVTSLASPAVHGGIFVIPMTSHPLLFIGLWFLGSCITGVIYALWKKPLPVETN